MAKLSLDGGRIAQKLKTRETLIAVANTLLLQGKDISVELVAKEAGISKATAYRYFTGTEVLRREASLQLKAKTSDDLFANIPEKDLKARVNKLIDYHFELFTKNETEFRLFLSSVISESIHPKSGYSRAGRRIVLIEEALKPLRKTTDPATFKHMVNALSIFFGIESITVLKDLCKLDNEAILETWRWSVHRIVFG
ncbi:transcriptional regulator, TetR family [Chitinophaga ginsengisegetis]|jgi:AcrR family transcriptional regulator|uniref:Transcriptional regulator, TetR family n=1 Tax=Chitinophaga ginsengisegetis TaxID=393003 RepID=A0A1T5P907_9BACT|nr:TetR/AcrR family transcriptional regulator [Chitinophaga ginsengisegetis]MDR6570809.1 AcrR family transcriptional regulator [Chitinophaga ginsengisegetis]MDR6650543.1 AcrR family transcriptional regulator [Chitinophaga ginsengisegetis]MDR6656818.1 AcrR family transcriptional regulator [Chitinophaga ginsengisegetis]SKD09234.1 transcriptional regulator, TetR family [Chitinophaga ginsengisegetis]